MDYNEKKITFLIQRKKSLKPIRRARIEESKKKPQKKHPQVDFTLVDFEQIKRD